MLEKEKDDPMFNVSFDTNGKPKTRDNRRVGRPRDKWILQNMELAWQHISQQTGDDRVYSATTSADAYRSFRR